LFGITLRRRVGGSETGWQLKVPSGTARTELQSGSRARTLPHALAEGIEGLLADGGAYQSSDAGAALGGRRGGCKSGDRLVGDLRATEKIRVLTLRGEAGVGKSALLVPCQSYPRGAGCRIVCARQASSRKMELASTELHQLCARFLDGLDGLPAPQRPCESWQAQPGRLPGAISRSVSPQLAESQTGTVQSTPATAT
jgi:hypothetical protein